MGETLSSQPVSTRLQRIAEQAKARPEMVFTTLAHLIDMELLREAYQRTRKDSSPGVDGVTAKEYGVPWKRTLASYTSGCVHSSITRRRSSAPTLRKRTGAKDRLACRYLRARWSSGQWSCC